MDLESRRQIWESRWTSDVYKYWHMEDRNPVLWKYLHLLRPDDPSTSGLFLVPMCGKCLDLKFLYEEGFKVLGIEFYEEAVKEFFAENDIPYEVTTLSQDFKVYGTADNQLRIACGDILEFKKEYLGGDLVKMVWDRGSMVAIEKEKRKAYAVVLKSLTEDPQVKYLLDCWEYCDWYCSDIPRSCPLEMIKDLFGDTFDIRELQRAECKVGVKSIMANNVIHFLTVKNT